VLHSTFSRRGGKARSAAKTAANRAKAASFWNAVRAGQRQPPARPRTPPDPQSIARLLAPCFRTEGIERLEIFGSVARGEARRGSDVDLIARFTEHPGLRIVSIEEEMAARLGVPVHLLTAEQVAEMDNPFRKASIENDRRVIYEA